MPASIQRIARSVALGCLLLAAACGNPRHSDPGPLTPEEVRLVEETVQLIRIRLERTRDPERAQDMRDSLQGLYTEEERRILLEKLAVDAARGEKVMAALNDSLQALRGELFPSTMP